MKTGWASTASRFSAGSSLSSTRWFPEPTATVALFRDALASLYISVALFSLGSLLGGVVNLWRPESLWFVGGLIISGISCIVFAAVQLVRESLLSLNVIQEHYERIEHEPSQQTEAD